MKNLFCAMVCAAFYATTASAGSLSEPVVEPVIVAEEAAGSSGDAGNLVIPLVVLFALIGIAGT